MVSHTPQSTQSPQEEQEQLQRKWQNRLEERAREVDISEREDRLLMLRHSWSYFGLY